LTYHTIYAFIFLRKGGVMNALLLIGILCTFLGGSFFIIFFMLRNTAQQRFNIIVRAFGGEFERKKEIVLAKEQDILDRLRVYIIISVIAFLLGAVVLALWFIILQ
jgi:hypothetical protein